MADYDGSIRLGASLDVDRKSLTSQLNSMTKDIKKAFEGLGSEVSKIPSSFSNVTKSVSKSVSKISKGSKQVEISPVQELTQYYEEQKSILDNLNTTLSEYKENLSSVKQDIKILSPVGRKPISTDASYRSYKKLSDTETQLRKNIATTNKSISEQEELVKEVASRLEKLKESEFNKNFTIPMEDKSNAFSDEIPTTELGKKISMLQTLQQSMAKFNKTGLGFDTDEEWQLASQLIEKYKTEIEELKQSLSGIKAEPPIDAYELEQTRQKYQELEIQGERTFGGRLKGLISSLISKLKDLRNHTKKTGNDFGKNFGKSLLTIGKLIFGVRSLFVLFRKLRQVVIQAFNTLAVQFPEINRQLSELKTSMQGLKASLGTALQPLFSALQPLLNSIIQKLTTAIELVGKFFASLTGQKYIYKATTAWQDYAGAIEDTNEKLGAYDKLNVIQQDTGGGGNTLQGVTYNKEDLGDLMDLDAYGWGQYFGTKIQEALMSIPWEEIKQKAAAAATYMGEFLNGFFETAIDGVSLGYTIGDTLAQAINTGFIFLNTFIKTIHWDSVGSFIAQSVFGFIKNLDLSLYGQSISLKIIALFDYISGFIESINWQEIPKLVIDKISEFVSGIDFSGLAQSFGRVFGNAVKLGFDLMVGIGEIVGQFFQKIKDYFAQYTLNKEGWDIVAGVLQGILDALANIATWIYDNILVPFINGFKQAFGIASPSTLMMEMGEYIIEGLKEGIGDIWAKIGEKFTSAKDKITEVWTNTKNNAVNLFENMKSQLSNVAGNLKNGLVNIFTGLKNSLINIFNGIWGKIRETINLIIGGVERMANGVINGINAVIRALNGLHFDVPSWVPKLGGHSFGFNIPSLGGISIPRLAQGAVIPPNREFLAMLGDQSDGTNIEAPLDTIKQALLEALSESGRNDAPIVLQLNSKVIAKAVWDENEKRYKQLGKYAY